jgi:hypothetical protein
MDGSTSVVETVTILVSEPERLRDYFIRLGRRAAVAGPGTVTVELDVPGLTEVVDDQLYHWVAATEVTASIQADLPAPVPLAPAGRSASSFFLDLDRPRLGDLLVRKGLIEQEQLERALAESRGTGDLLGRVMIRRGFIFEDELARTLAAQLDLPYVNIRVAGFERGAAQLLPSGDGMRAAAIPVGVFGGQIRVAFADPSDESAKELVRRHVGEFNPAVAALSDIEFAWRTLDPSCAHVA